MKERVMMAVTGRGTNGANKLNAVDGEKLKIRLKNRKLYVCGTVFPRVKKMEMTNQRGWDE